MTPGAGPFEGLEGNPAPGGPEVGLDGRIEELRAGFAALLRDSHERFDGELPRLAEALLAIADPVTLATIPAMAVAQIEPVAPPPWGVDLPRGTLVRPLVSGQLGACRFRTTAAARYWPIRVASAERAGAEIRLLLEPVGGGLGSLLGLDRLRLYLDGDTGSTAVLAAALLSVGGVGAARIAAMARDGRPAALPPPAPATLRQGGLDPRSEGMLPADGRTFAGARLLAEHFAFPERSLFVDVEGFDAFWSRRPDGAPALPAWARDFGAFELVVPIDPHGPAPPPGPIGPARVLANCVPLINLFRVNGRAQGQDGRRPELLVRVEGPEAGCEVHSVDAVYAPQGPGRVDYAPAHRRRHRDALLPPDRFWAESRRPRADGAGVDTFLTLIDAEGGRRPELTVFADLTCSNGGLPASLTRGTRLGWFADRADNPPLAPLVLLDAPTPPLRPPARPDAWRLVGGLGRSVPDLGSPEESLAALREAILTAADAERRPQGPSAAYAEGRRARLRAAQLGLVGVGCTPSAFEWTGGGPVRGLDIRLDLDPAVFPGRAPYPFAAVLAAYLRCCTSINGAVRVTAFTPLGERIGRWEPRLGDRMRA